MLNVKLDVSDKLDRLVRDFIEAFGNRHQPTLKELIIMPKYKADQEDFEINVGFKGTDSEGHASTRGVDFEFTSTDESVVTVTPTTKGKANVHVGGPGNDADGQATIEVKLKKSKNGEVIGFGSLPVIVTAGDVDSVAEVEILGAPAGEVEDTPPVE